MKIFKKNYEKMIWWSGMVVTGIVLGFSLQLVGAWMGAPGNHSSSNIGAPINTSSQPQTKPGTLGLNALITQAFVMNDGNPTGDNLKDSVLVSNAYGQASWQKLDCKPAPACTGGNNCIKPDGSCGRLFIRVTGGSNIGMSCNTQAGFVYPDGETPDNFDGSCSQDSGRLTIDVHAKVYCKGNFKTPLPAKFQGGAACVNKDGTYGWVQAYVQSGLTNGECGIGWSWTDEYLKPDEWRHWHAECGDGGAAGRRDYNMDALWSCI